MICTLIFLPFPSARHFHYHYHYHFRLQFFLSCLPAPVSRVGHLLELHSALGFSPKDHEMSRSFDTYANKFSPPAIQRSADESQRRSDIWIDSN
jgi:hypothetical protein